MYVYCAESFAHIECYSDCSRMGAIWLNPFSTVLFNVCNAVLFCIRVAWVCLVYLLLCKEEGSSPVCLQLQGGWIWACMRCPYQVFVGFWDGDYVSQLPYVWYYVGVKSRFQHTREECEFKRAYVF